jgi:[acyl-carrier-protein] S-malonyltransferase
MLINLNFYFIKAYIFPGQGSQYHNMGKDIYQSSSKARKLFHMSNEILKFNISKIMFESDEKILTKTNINQLSIYIYTVIKTLIDDTFNPSMVAGHSLGEYTALTVTKALKFQEGLKLINYRGKLMNQICENKKLKMIAVLGLKDEIVEKICKKYTNHISPALYNYDGQIVLTGKADLILKIKKILYNIGAHHVMDIPIQGGFHTPFMAPIINNFQKKLNTIHITKPICPIYQNANAKKTQNPEIIKNNLIKQITFPVKWKQTIIEMSKDGAKDFIEIGPKKILSIFIRKILQKKHA